MSKHKTEHLAPSYMLYLCHRHVKHSASRP